jgi:dienelactone hydrolase
VRERAVLLGKKKNLVAVITESEQRLSGRPPGAILLNAGLIHRVGPHRINVQIARRLAASGFHAIRLDLAGIGDSANRTDDLSLQAGVVSDVKAAMDFLGHEYELGQFVLMGICSGANNALQVAQHEARVSGIVCIEPYYFATTAYHIYVYKKRLLNPRSWRRLVATDSDFWRILKRKFRAGNLRTIKNQKNRIPGGQHESFKHRITSEIQSLIGRGVNLHFVYCMDSPSYYNHHLPLRDHEDFLPQYHSSLFENTDHTFTLLSAQQMLVNTIDEWMKTLAKTESLRSESRKARVSRFEVTPL